MYAVSVLDRKILGFLDDGPLHGYELRRRIADPAGPNPRRQAIESAQQNTKPEDLTDAEKADRKQVNDDIAAQEKLREEALADYARTNKLVPQLIDLALLQNGLLRGEALNAFVKRSVELI